MIDGFHLLRPDLLWALLACPLVALALWYRRVHQGDWTKVNPWRAPGTAGMGNPDFQPCGINSGSKKEFPNPPTSRDHTVPKAGPGTSLAPVGKGPVWRRGSVRESRAASGPNF